MVVHGQKRHLKFQQDLKELISSLEIWISSRLRPLAAPATPTVYLHQQVPQEVTDVHFLPTCWLRILPERVVSFTSLVGYSSWGHKELDMTEVT